MREIENLEKHLISHYHRFILHMRQRRNDNMFIMCFGAGISKYWGCPNWDGLIKRISENEEFINVEHLKTADEMAMTSTTKAQLLYEELRGKYPNECEAEITVRWIEIVHSELYKNNKTDFNHPYLGTFLKIIRESPVTINYNFDDYIEQAIYEKFHKEENIKREYETVWLPSTQFKRKQGVIYHPNGFIPKRLFEGYSEHFVFTESAYADQLLASMHGHYNTLFSLLTRYTALFIGLSLTDVTLKHLLHQNAKINPGHYHYYVYYIDKNDSIPEIEKIAIQKMYFKVYNLLVLFLTEEEIKCLGNLLEKDSDELKLLAEDLNLPDQYRYYISGIPGVGKTTVLNYFKTFSVHNEWPDHKIENIDKQPNDLSTEALKKVDEWISKQFRKKNIAINDDKSPIQLIDRSLVDPLTFTIDDNISKRATELVETFKRRRICDGQILLLDAQPYIANNRLKKRNSQIRDDDWTDRQRKTFKNIFSKNGELAATLIDTSFLSVEEVVKKIGEEVLFERYTPIDFNGLLNKFKSSEGQVH